MSYCEPKSQTYRIKYDTVKEMFCCRIISSNNYTIGIGWGRNPEASLTSAQLDRNYRLAQH